MEWGFIEIMLIVIFVFQLIMNWHLTKRGTIVTEQLVLQGKQYFAELDKQSDFLDNKILQINNRFDSLYQRIATVDLIEEKFKYFTKQIYEFNGEGEQEKKYAKKLEEINYAIRQMNKENSERNK